MLQDKTKKLLRKVVKRFDEIKNKSFPMTREKNWSSELENTVIGKIWWNNQELIWILSTNNDEGYEGSQSQIGVAKDGTLRWEYQSHCSCYSYEDTSGLPEQFTKETLKSFNFTYTKPPLDWEIKMQENMEKLLSL